MMPVMDGDGDGDDEIDEKDGEDEEVHGRIEATVVFVVLGCGHGGPFWEQENSIASQGTGNREQGTR